MEAAGLAHREEVAAAIEDAAALVLGVPAGERLGLPDGSRVLARRCVRFTGQPGGGAPAGADSLADGYYPFGLVRDTALASPAPADPAGVLAGTGRRVRGFRDELRPRLATTEERRLLSLPQVSVVLEVARTAWGTGRQPVAVLHQVRRRDGATFAYDTGSTSR